MVLIQNLRIFHARFFIRKEEQLKTFTFHPNLKTIKCNQPEFEACWFDPRRTFVLNALFSLWSCGHPVSGTVGIWLIAVESVFGSSDTFMLWHLFCSEDNNFDFHFSNDSLIFTDFCLICCSGSFLCCLGSLSLLCPNLPVLVVFSSPREEKSLCTITVWKPCT